MDIADNVPSRLSPLNVVIVTTAPLPQQRIDPSLLLCTLRWPLLERLQKRRHIVGFIQRKHQEMYMIRHEDVGEDHKVVLLRRLIDELRQHRADPLVEQKRLAMIG